uniref:Cystatin domain-containing protein n=1 Tax=Strongyloides venezuelensis TaxID=75913 RepID=A0A0K0G4E8_STRVS
MNYINLSIFIFAIFLIITEAFPGLHNSLKWKNKNPTDNKIVELGKEVVKLFNRDYHLNTIFNRVLEAEKQNTKAFKRYHLEVMVLTACEGKNEVCQQKIGADIFKKKRSPQETEMYVYKESDNDSNENENNNLVE